MKQLFIPIIIIAIVCLVVYFFLKRKKSVGTEVIDKKEYMLVENKREIQPVSFELISEMSDTEMNQLVAITDKKVIARIESAIPNTVRTVQNVDAAKKISDAVKEGGKFYQAIIPTGASLDKSRDMEGAFRATYREVQNSIQGQANLKPVDGAMAASQAANITNAVMNVGSLVVGQYYMAQISAELNELSDSVNQIKGFQDSEFKSRIAAVLMEVQKISSFETEFLENEEQRKIKIKELGEYEHEAVQLLNQVNDQLNEITKNKNIDYKTYEGQLKKISLLRQYQVILINCLHSIDELTYTFNLGRVSERTCFTHFRTLSGATDKAINKLTAWHMNLIDKFEIDTYEKKRARQGFEAILYKPISLIDDKFSYKKISPGVAEMISKQSTDDIVNTRNERDDLFNKDVHLIERDGQYYYLPSQPSQSA